VRTLKEGLAAKMQRFHFGKLEEEGSEHNFFGGREPSAR
jgi:hypothetical protein